MDVVVESRTPVSSEVSQLEELADRVGDFIKYWGFKRIHGQIWVHLYLSKEPLDAGQLIKRLGVSKALISMSLSDLLSYDVVHRAGKSTHGTQLYEANEDIEAVIVNVIKTREQKLVAKAKVAFEALDSLSVFEKERLHLDQTRLDSMGEMMGAASAAVRALLSASTIESTILRKLGGISIRALSS